MTLLADLEEFVAAHQPHKALAWGTTAPTPNGYQVEVACPCGVTWRWLPWRQLMPPPAGGCQGFQVCHRRPEGEPAGNRLAASSTGEKDKSGGSP